MIYTNIVNLALQVIGTRTTVTDAELANNSTNEAIQANLAIFQTRDELLRMAPWQCCTGMINLTYITSLPGTPENQSTPASQLQWTRGLPLPPWTYEYAYPEDCLRALWIVPQFSMGIQGPPIYPTSTFTGYSAIQQGPPIRFTVGVDQFYSGVTVTIDDPGALYAAGDVITLPIGAISNPPIGAPAQVRVLTADVGTGAILTATLVNMVPGSATPISGFYFNKVFGAQAQASTTGNGSGATFTLTYGPLTSQRVVLTNQEYGTLAYCRRITDPNTMDSMFQKAWYNILGAVLCMALTGDKALANRLVQIANGIIAEARANDANEELTINDVTPDFIRVRGVIYSDYWTGSSSFDWGSFWSAY